MCGVYPFHDKIIHYRFDRKMYSFLYSSFQISTNFITMECTKSYLSGGGISSIFKTGSGCSICQIVPS